MSKNINEMSDAEIFEAQVTGSLNVESTKLAEMLKEHGTKSNVIRFLDNAGWKRGNIAKFMNIKYQFVRNVLENDKLRKKVGSK